MTEFNHGAFIADLRKRRGKVPADLYNDIMASLAIGLGKSAPTGTPVGAKPTGNTPWVTEAKAHIGLKEIPGPKHNPKIIGWIKKLGGWFTDDETPWCGTFAAYCMTIAGQPIPKNWFRARDWESWGKASSPRVGAVVVFSRTGGGHVGFLMGESATHFYVLGGNQSNKVSVAPLDKKNVTAIRWPTSLPLSDERLPAMSGGASTTSLS